ncbi:hypothetical protein [Microbispora rosea]|uniref:hypothetical protein n=1 Tax=Microbispora rosea TaxID=58117 RepID=UPI003D89D9ED
MEHDNDGSLFACRGCLTAFVAQIRRKHHAASGRVVQRPIGTLLPALNRYLSSIENVRRAGEGVERLAEAGNLESLQLAWLLVSLESAHTWAVDERPESLSAATEGSAEVKRVEFALFLQMYQVRSLVANAFAYHLINEAAPAEPETCAEFECPPDCQGRHDVEHIDCGPDDIYEALARHGVSVREEDTGHEDDMNAEVSS